MTADEDASERRCAQRMHAIMEGIVPLVDADYNVEEIAERYVVHRDTVYKGVRAGSPLFPKPHRKGTGPKAWLYFSAAAVQESDRNRILFYKTTPSWHEVYGDGATSAPRRCSAADVVAAQRSKRRKGSGA
jgi:hypothetical protein